MRAGDLTMVVTLSRPAKRSSGNFVVIQNALSNCSAPDPGETLLAALVPSRPVTVTARTAIVICRHTLIAAECDSAAMNGEFRDLLNNWFTLRSDRQDFFLNISSTLQGPPPAKAMYRKMKQNRMAASPPFNSG